MSHCSTCKCASVPTSQFNFKRKVGDARLPVKAVGMMTSLDTNDINVHVLLTPLTDRELRSGSSGDLLCPFKMDRMYSLS